MNKMHSVAKIVLVGLALYMAFFLCTHLMAMPLILLADARYEWSMLPIVVFVLVYVCLGAGVCALIYKRDKLAEKIVGTGDLPGPDLQIQWLPVAFRLVSVATGLFCLYRGIAGVIFTLQRYLTFKTHGASYLPIAFERLLSYVILLALAIYLLCGAPHFVRWHVKKTIEQCKEITENPGAHQGS